MGARGTIGPPWSIVGTLHAQAGTRATATPICRRGPSGDRRLGSGGSNTIGRWLGDLSVQLLGDRDPTVQVVPHRLHVRLELVEHPLMLVPLRAELARGSAVPDGRVELLLHEGRQRAEVRRLLAEV